MAKLTRGEKVFNFINIFILTFITIIIAVPILNVVLNSMVSYEESMSKQIIIIPEKLDFTAYKLIFLSANNLINGFLITFFRVIVGTFLNMIFSYFLAYVLAKKDFFGRTVITVYLFFVMLFSGGLIPYYIIVKHAHLINSIWVYIIPGLISVWNVLLLRNFIMHIPESLNESAEIDGASQMTILFNIIIPLSAPALATIALFYAVGHWNSWFDAFLFVSDSKKQPVQMILRDILTTASFSFETSRKSLLDVLTRRRPPVRSIQNATIVVTTLPIVLVYPFLQKYFVKGIIVGGVKG